MPAGVRSLVGFHQVCYRWCNAFPSLYRAGRVLIPDTEHIVNSLKNNGVRIRISGLPCKQRQRGSLPRSSTKIIEPNSAGIVDREKSRVSTEITMSHWTSGEVITLSR
jgi:hypothetical protein